MEHKIQNSNDEKNKQWIKLIAMIALISFGVILIILMRHHQTKVTQTKVETTKFETGLNHINDRDSILEKAQRRAQEAENKAQELEEKLLETSKAQMKMIEEMQQKMDLLENNIQKSKASNLDLNDPFAVQNSQYENKSMRRDILILQEQKNLTQKEPIKNPDTYVPSGTFVKAVMLGGADTSTSANAQSNPEPMLFRIIESGTLPNGKKSHLRNCVVVGKVHGDISSERGIIRTRSLSCVLKNNEVTDQRVEGYIFGPEGKYGVRGNPVWREGALLQRAFVAGTLSGFAEGLKQTYTTQSISPLGATQTVQNGAIFKYGVAAGASNAMDKLAEYNIRRAELYHPVIQISAGTVVDIVFKEGFFLDGKKHDEKEERKSNIEEISFKPQQQINDSIFNHGNADQLKDGHLE